MTELYKFKVKRNDNEDFDVDEKLMGSSIKYLLKSNSIDEKLIKVKIDEKKKQLDIVILFRKDPNDKKYKKTFKSLYELFKSFKTEFTSSLDD